MNPLVVGSVSGVVFQAFNIPLPQAVAQVTQTLGSASLPLGLLCVGAALDFSTARQWIVPCVSSSFMKFVAMPFFTIVVASVCGLKGPAMTTALLFQTLPTASSAYIMARQLGGNAPLMAGITAIQTILSILILPIILIISSYLFHII